MSLKDTLREARTNNMFVRDRMGLTVANARKIASILRRTSDKQEIEERRHLVEELIREGADTRQTYEVLNRALACEDYVVADKLIQNGVSDEGIKHCIRIANNPENGISAEERQKRMDYLTNAIGKEKMTALQNEITQEKAMATMKARQVSRS